MGLSFLLSCERRSWLCAGIVFVNASRPRHVAHPPRGRCRLQPPSCFTSPVKKAVEATLQPLLLPCSDSPSLCLINPMACRTPPPTLPLLN